MTDQWAQISCEVPAEIVETVADFLVEFTNNGVGIDNITLDTFSLESLEESPVKTITAYLPADEMLARNLEEIEAYLAGQAENFPDFRFRPPTVTCISEEDWSTSWKEHFKPIRIGRRLVIKPTWETFSASGSDIVLELDPGMAFGTGTHPTTMLCLATLEKLFGGPDGENTERMNPRTVLDVGTGSGILSIAAVKLGAEKVTAVDIDPEAVRVAGENCALNGVSGAVTVSDSPLETLEENYDIVLANILAEDLVRMSSDLVGRIARNGYLILSGILTEKEVLVTDGYAPHDVSLVEISREEEWSCLVYRRKE